MSNQESPYKRLFKMAFIVAPLIGIIAGFIYTSSNKNHYSQFEKKQPNLIVVEKEKEIPKVSNDSIMISIKEYEKLLRNNKSSEKKDIDSILVIAVKLSEGQGLYSITDSLNKELKDGYEILTREEVKRLNPVPNNNYKTLQLGHEFTFKFKRK